MIDAIDDDAVRLPALAHDIRALVGKLRRRLREQADSGDLTPSQTAVLLRLEKHGPLTASALARAEAMRPQSMGAIVAALTSAGLVAGSADPADARQTLLSLTDACRRWIEDGRTARQDWLLRTLQSRFSPDEHAHLIHAVTLLERLAAD